MTKMCDACGKNFPKFRASWIETITNTWVCWWVCLSCAKTLLNEHLPMFQLVAKKRR